MPIVANHVPSGLGNDKFLQHPKTNHADYANYIKEQFNVGAIDGDSDHFVTIVNKVNHIAEIYRAAPTTGTIDNQIIPEFRSETGGSLRSWLSALLCCMMYGCEEDTDIHIAGRKFKDNSPTPATIPTLQYLEIWKRKFSNTSGSGNSNDGTVAQINGANVLEKGCDKDSFNYVTLDSNIPAKAVGYHNIVGTFHDQLFVIPLKEYDLDGVAGTVPEWKKKYKYLCGTKDNHNEFIERLKGLNIKQRIFLRLSANSITNLATAPVPLKFAAAFIDHIIELPNGVLPDNPNGVLPYPAFKTINGISFFKTDDHWDLDNLVSPVLYIGRDSDGFRATYPLTPMSIAALKAKNEISNMKLEVTTDFSDSSAVISAKVSFRIRTELEFVPSPEFAGVLEKLSFDYPVTKTYKADKGEIKWIRMLPTICMYPNLSSNLEDRCNQFTYFSRKGTNILLNRINGLGQYIDLSNGLFLGSLDGSNLKRKLIDFTPGAAAPYKNVKAYGEAEISTTRASKAEHFIQVSDNFGNNCMGYVLNIRTHANGDIPSLLVDGAEGVTIKIDEPTAKLPQGNPAETLRAYIDFGSSSSYVRYSIGGANLNNSLVESKCTLRRCLTEYVKGNEYEAVINDPEKNSLHKFLSNASVYENDTPTTEFLPYVDAWMPIVNSYKNYPNIKNISTSHKTDVAKDGSASIIPRVILHNICYTIACNAVNFNCNNIELVPSFPSDDYVNNLNTMWDTVTSNINAIFPGIEFINYLSKDNKHLLYESVAISLGDSMPAANSMNIYIDMGDGTTDMSAIYVDNLGQINLSGYSSVEYAGKNLIKTVIKDVLEKADASVEKIFKGSLDNVCAPYGPPLFKTKNGEAESYKGYVDNMTSEWKATQNDDAFESTVMDILALGSLGSGLNNDHKVAANFILRYMILMPVVKDFIHTAIKIAGDMYDPTMSTINVNFKGGSAKGIDLFGTLDHRGINSRTIIVDKYFKNEFYPDLATNVTVSISTVDDKKTLIDGLYRIQGSANAPGLNVGGVKVANIDWDNKVSPTYRGVFGKKDNIHKNTLKQPFECILLANGNVDTVKSEARNTSLIKSTASYYESPSNPFEEFKEYFNSEIYDKLIDNHDGEPDVIEMLVVNFLNEASPAMISTINQELTNIPGSSFVKATNSFIYPEMMKSAIFMFTISKLLTKYHGKYHPNHTITKLADVTGNEFGG